jgi:hypothetical protein
VQQPCFGYFFLASGSSQWLWQEAQLPLQPSPFQPPCLEIQTTASANSTANITSVMIPRSVSIFIPRFLLCSFLPPKYTRFAGKEQQPAAHFFVQGAAAAAARRQCCTTGVRRNIFAARKKVSKKVKVFQIRACISAKAVL